MAAAAARSEACHEGWHSHDVRQGQLTRTDETDEGSLSCDVSAAGGSGQGAEGGTAGRQ